MKKENGQSVMVPLFQSQENIAGKVFSKQCGYDLIASLSCFDISF